MNVICCDLEGVFVPEIWINVAQKTGIEDLRLTTRDISDYDKLMKHRLSVLSRHGLKLGDITAVIATIEPLDGAVDFLDRLRRKAPVIIVSDTFTQFAGPLMEKLKMPTLFCNTLVVDKDGSIADYKLRQEDGKRHVAVALRSLNYRVIAMGDSYNDIGMLKEADTGILFRPPENVIREFPEFPVVNGYGELESMLAAHLENQLA
ncbi:MAG: phosphoserine phosphatase [Desulfococcus sp. 4484_241]|nr:MAG: phosphoserine phosphatase [Desulfococcus sp. 4484_241]